MVVDTPSSTEAYGVLVAPAGRRWRARVLTYPSTLWTLPGGRGILKFVAPTPYLAEQQAVRFIREHCAACGYQIRSRSAAVNPLLAAPKPVVSLSSRHAISVPPRRPIVLPVQYGLGVLSLRGITRNLSEGGVFLQTPSVFNAGWAVQLRLGLAPENVLLRGVVVWKRRTLEPGRPPGMGIRLVEPPTSYVSYVRSLPAQTLSPGGP